MNENGFFEGDCVMEQKNEKKFFTVREFHQAIGGIVTRSQIYRMIQNGEIPVRRIGNKVVLSADWVNNYINIPCSCVRKEVTKDGTSCER